MSGQQYEDVDLCVEYVPFEVARAHCEANSLTLCTRQQLADGAGWDADEDTGCGVDTKLVWTRDECEPEIAGLKVDGSVTLKTSGGCQTEAQAQALIAQVLEKDPRFFSLHPSQVTINNIECIVGEGRRARQLPEKVSDYYEDEAHSESSPHQQDEELREGEHEYYYGYADLPPELNVRSKSSPHQQALEFYYGYSDQPNEDRGREGRENSKLHIDVKYSRRLDEQNICDGLKDPSVIENPLECDAWAAGQGPFGYCCQPPNFNEEFVPWPSRAPTKEPTDAPKKLEAESDDSCEWYEYYFAQGQRSPEIYVEARRYFSEHFFRLCAHSYGPRILILA